MDNAVAFVRAYLHVNGYFTVCEHPVLEAMANGGYQEATDFDVLAIRFPRAPCGGVGHRRDRRDGGVVPPPVDPEIGAALDQPDMIIAEVKEGPAALNRGARDPRVLAAALVRFGCSAPEHLDRAVQGLLRRGIANLPNGHLVRLVAFGAAPDPVPTTFHAVTLSHVIRFLADYVHRNWHVLRHVQLKDPALAVLALLEKTRDEPRTHPISSPLGGDAP